MSNEAFFPPTPVCWAAAERLLSAADSSVVGSKVNSTTFAIVTADRDFVEQDLGAV